MPRRAAKRSKTGRGSVATTVSGVWPDGLWKVTCAIGVPGDQHQVPAGPGRVVLRAPDLRVHRGDDQPARLQFGGQPGGIQFRDHIGLQPVLVPAYSAKGR